MVNNIIEEIKRIFKQKFEMHEQINKIMNSMHSTIIIYDETLKQIKEINMQYYDYKIIISRQNVIIKTGIEKTEKLVIEYDFITEAENNLKLLENENINLEVIKRKQIEEAIDHFKNRLSKCGITAVIGQQREIYMVAYNVLKKELNNMIKEEENGQFKIEVRQFADFKVLKQFIYDKKLQKQNILEIQHQAVNGWYVLVYFIDN